MFQIDRSKTALANMTALINTGSSYAFTGSEFTLSAASPETPADPQENTNTQVTLTTVANSGFTGSKVLRYRRVALGATKPGAKTSYVITGADTLATIKTAIAIEHNLIESEFDLTGTIPAQGAPAATFTMTAHAGSLLYTGTYTVSVVYS